MDKSRAIQLQVFELVEESVQSWIIARLLGSTLRKAMGEERAAQKIRAAREMAEGWISEVREKCRETAVHTKQVAPMEYHEIMKARANFGDLPRELPDLRGRHRGAPLPDLRKARWRYQEILTHLKAQQPSRPQELQHIVPNLSHARAKELVGKKDYLIAAAITADEFRMKASIIPRKTKGFPMSVSNQLGVWQLDPRGRCTFQPWVKGGKDLGKPARVRGFGDLPREFRLPSLAGTPSL